MRACAAAVDFVRVRLAAAAGAPSLAWAEHLRSSLRLHLPQACSRATRTRAGDGAAKDPGARLQRICGELCDACLAPDADEGDGRGCDNMTVLIVALQQGDGLAAPMCAARAPPAAKKRRCQ